MATYNFSVPDDVKAEFNAVFAGENRSAILSGLMRRAIEERRREERRAAAIDALLETRARIDPAAEREILEAREFGRP